MRSGLDTAERDKVEREGEKERKKTEWPKDWRRRDPCQFPTASALVKGPLSASLSLTSSTRELDNLAKLANPAPGNRRGESLDVVPRPKELVDGVSSQQASYSVCTCILPFARGA